MKFTETPPTEPGWYWVQIKFFGKILKDSVRPVELTDSGLVYEFGCDASTADLYVWGDRIEEPEVEL